MRRSVRIAGATVALVTVAACGSGSGGGNASVGPAIAGLRGVPLPAISCQETTTTPAARPIASGTVTSLILCPPRIPDRGVDRVTVQRGSASFDSLLAALALPNRAPSRLPCPAYADVPQLVIAVTAKGPYLVSIPVDGCHHYLPQALAALNRARGVMPTSGLPAQL